MITARGFTLIETLIYIGLLTILMTGTLVSAYAMSEFSARYRSAARLEQEGAFLLRSILWHAQAGTIDYPETGQGAERLSVRDTDGRIVSFEKDGDYLTVSVDGVTRPLSTYQLAAFAIERTGTRSDPLDPEQVMVSLALPAFANGTRTERVFSDAIYLYGGK